MQKNITSLLLIILLGAHAVTAATENIKIMTRWGRTLDTARVWQEYPRPKLQRAEWQNLNGVWQCSITQGEQSPRFDRQIVVPFCVESALSGVAQMVSPQDVIHYRRTFRIDTKNLRDKAVILHFGAVDVECRVWINGKEAGSHKGGNTAFSFDITKLLKSGIQSIDVEVKDPTDTGSQARGKQVLDPKGIWYTAVSGIWQTVWLECVGTSRIENILPRTDINDGIVRFAIQTKAVKTSDKIKIEVSKGGTVLCTQSFDITAEVKMQISNPQLWTPDTPHLYDVKMTLLRNGKEIDKVKSYFAFRKVSKVVDACGYSRIGLNGQPIFQYGTLDQGWWPDGLLTPPSAEAMRWDMEQLKSMGFNTIRKHIKVEPELYYYYADSLGLMIIQDMPSGGVSAHKEAFISAYDKQDWNASEEHKAQWEWELSQMISQLEFYPSITQWMIFNEGWGQFDTRRVVDAVAKRDPSRLLVGVSGWTERYVGDVYDIHNYTQCSMIEPPYCGHRISVLGEFGGLGLPVQGHLWFDKERNWGYANIDQASQYLADYISLVADVKALIPIGLSCAIYTQTTDVEGEVNGLITYDREVVKVPTQLMHSIHTGLYKQPSRPYKILIADAQFKPAKRTIAVNGKDFATLEMPLPLAKASQLTTAEHFAVENIPEHLIFKTRFNATCTVRINGQRVFTRSVHRTRHYNYYDISDYTNTINNGDNIIEIEAKADGNRDSNFDYALIAY